MPYFLVQPYGRDKGREATQLSTHATVAEAFRALDALTAAMLRTGTPPENFIEVLVTDQDGRVIPRPDAH